MPSQHNGMTVPEYTDAADAPSAFTALIDSGPIPRFATAAARAAAIAAPVRGMLSWRDDAGTIEVFDGAAWVAPFALLSGATFAGDVAARNLIANAAPSSTWLPNTVIDTNGKIFRSTTAAAAATHTHPFVQGSAGGSERGGSSSAWRSTSYVDLLSFTVTRPSGWGQYTLVVEADAQFATLSGTGLSCQVNTRILFGASASHVNLSPTVKSGESYQPIIKHAVDRLTGNTVVKVQANLKDLTGAPNFGALRFTEATWHAHRTS